MNDITKKLQKLVSRKGTKVILEQRKFNQYSRKNHNGTSFSDYEYGDSEDN